MEERELHRNSTHQAGHEFTTNIYYLFNENIFLLIYSTSSEIYFRIQCPTIQIRYCSRWAHWSVCDNLWFEQVTTLVSPTMIAPLFKTIGSQGLTFFEMLPSIGGCEKLVYRLIGLHHRTEIFSKRRKIYTKCSEARVHSTTQPSGYRIYT